MFCNLLGFLAKEEATAKAAISQEARIPAPLCGVYLVWVCTQLVPQNPPPSPAHSPTTSGEGWLARSWGLFRDRPPISGAFPSKGKLGFPESENRSHSDTSDLPQTIPQGAIWDFWKVAMVFLRETKHTVFSPWSFVTRTGGLNVLRSPDVKTKTSSL